MIEESGRVGEDDLGMSKTQEGASPVALAVNQALCDSEDSNIDHSGCDLVEKEGDADDILEIMVEEGKVLFIPHPRNSHDL